MKRIFAVLISLVMIITLLPAAAMADEAEGVLLDGGTSFVDVEYERFENAAQIALNTKVTVNVMNIIDGEYCRDAYINRFKIVLPSDGYINSVNECGLEIFADTQEEGKIADLGSWNLGLAAGTYYVKGSFHFCEPSYFTINYVPANDWEKELNNEASDATPIPQNTKMNGWLADWDEDWYRFTLPQAGIVTFGITYNYDQTDPEQYWFVELYDMPDGSEPDLLDGDGRSVSEATAVTVGNAGLSPGTYYLRVGGVSNFGAEEWGYKIFWNYSPSSTCETERNDTYETADVLPLNQAFFIQNTSAQPMHAQRYDPDYFKFTLDSPGPVWFSLTPDADGEFDFSLRDSNDNVMREFTLLGEKGKTASTTEQGLPAGTYYLDACRTAENIPYYLTVNYQAASGAWEQEDNNDFGSANGISPGSSIHGRVERFDDDVFAFSLSRQGTIDVGLAYQYHDDEENQDRDFILTLYNSEEEEVFSEGGYVCGADSDTKTGFSMKKIGLPAGKYYLKVWSNTITESVDNSYDLSLEFTANAYCETELNDHLDQADPISLDQAYLAQDMGRDQDSFRFTVPNDGKISVSVKGEAKGEYLFRILDSEEYVVEDVHYENVPAGVEVTGDLITLPAGTYYLYAQDAPEKVPYFFRINYAKQPEAADPLRIEPAEATLVYGQTLQLKAVPASGAADALNIEWSTDDDDTASVDEDGIVTAKGTGTATITAAANDGTYRKAECRITVVKAASTISLEPKQAEYTGDEIDIDEAKVSGSWGEVSYQYFSDAACTKAVSEHKDAGTYYVKASVAADEYFEAAVSEPVELVITRAKIDPTVTLSRTSYTYDGRQKKPAVTVENGWETLEENKDYTVTYGSGRINVGEYKVAVVLKGNYSGSKTVSFKITRAQNGIKAFTPAKKTVKYSRQSARTFRITVKLKSGKAPVFKKVSVSPSKNSKAISVSSAGIVTLKKGLAKGTYTLKVRITAKETNNYKAFTATKNVKIVVN